MYDGEEERKAAIPPPLEGTEEKIDETPEENLGASDRKEEQAPATTETQKKKAAEVKPAPKIAKAESNT